MADHKSIELSKKNYIDHISKFIKENHNPGFLANIQKDSDWNTVCEYEKTTATEILLQTKIFLRLTDSDARDTKYKKKLVWHIAGYLSQYFKNAPEFAGSTNQAKKYLRETISDFINRTSTHKKIIETAKKIGTDLVHTSVSHCYKNGKFVLVQHVSCDSKGKDFIYKDDAEFKANNEKDILKFLREIRAERTAKEMKSKTAPAKKKSRNAQVKSMIDKKRALLAKSQSK